VGQKCVTGTGWICDAYQLSMKPKNIYLLLSIVGAAVPYWAFIPWLFHAGASPGLLIRELFANRISTFFALDVMISAIVLLGFIRVEGSRNGIRHTWLPTLATVCVGVSLGLPMFLYMLENGSKELWDSGCRVRHPDS